MSELQRRGRGSSFLVRMWSEPAAEGSDRHPPRVYVRDLRSGEERYLNGVEGLVDFLARQRTAPRADGVADPAGRAGSRRRAG